MTSKEAIAQRPGPMSRFFDYLADGKFMIQRDTNSQKYVFYPREAASGEDFEWVPASGKATVYSYTTVVRKPERGGDYNVAIIELDEGPRMMSRVDECDPSEVNIGMPVTAKITSAKDGVPLLVFVPQAEVQS